MICTEEMRQVLAVIDLGAEVDFGTALICIEGLRLYRGHMREVLTFVGPNCPDLY